MEVKTDFSFRQILMMVEMLGVKNDEYLNLAGVARQIGVSPSNQQYLHLMKHLLANGIVAKVATAGSSHIVEIDNQLLADLLDEQETVKFLIHDYIRRYHTFAWGRIP